MAKTLSVDLEDEEQLCLLGSALSSPARIQILKLLYHSSMNVAEIAEKLDIPASSAAVYVRSLESAGLINTKIQKGTRGSMKICSRKYDTVDITLTSHDPTVDYVKSVSMPVGCYSNCEVVPTCGLASREGRIGQDDQLDSFFLPDHVKADILWTSGGFVEYKFPYTLPENANIKRIMLSFEACSETFNYKEDWISDISIRIDSLFCGTWRSPGDFGCRRGRLNPSWWPSGSTQYGELVRVEIREDGCYINSARVSDVTLSDFHFSSGKPISLVIENSESSEYVGGFNLFGRGFGDYEQDILLTFVY